MRVIGTPEEVVRPYQPGSGGSFTVVDLAGAGIVNPVAAVVAHQP